MYPDLMLKQSASGIIIHFGLFFIINKTFIMLAEILHFTY